MFTTTFYFIIVFALFSFSEQAAKPALNSYETAGAILAAYAFFYILVKSRFDRLET